MKKFYIVLSFLIAAAVLGGCGTSLTKEEIVNKATETEINSFNIDANIQMDINANGQKINQSVNMEMTYVNEPFFTHLKMNTVDGDVEMYLDKETSYIAEPGTNEWIQIPTSSIPQFAEMANGDNIKDELDRLKKFSDLFKLEKVKTGYVLYANLTKESNEKELELVKDVLTEAMQSIVVEDIKVNRFDYKLTLDENFLLKKAVAEADIDVTSEGETASFSTVTEANYTKINSITDYTVPKEITDNAIKQ